MAESNPDCSISQHFSARLAAGTEDGEATADNQPGTNRPRPTAHSLRYAGHLVEHGEADRLIDVLLALPWEQVQFDS
ncbi:hypothetical protein [Nocardia brasiliensis]|uniref:hypothetical protein n=1 Tax=Nocardia brasiliensis TaxID=37326 RepID=UPI0018940467|nr:hypothetical protein [Nocardia brasiliensis]MBF6548687.1 hypothetical protein [Nocardia brasiliensis]